MSTELDREEFLTTFRYDVSIFTSNNGVEKESSIGKYVTLINEKQKSLEVSTLVPNNSGDLLDVLNGDSKITRIVIRKRGERDGVIITSTYNIGPLVIYETHVASMDHGVHTFRLRGGCSREELAKLEELSNSLKDKGVVDSVLQELVEFLSKSDKLNICLNGSITDDDKNYGSQLSTVKLVLEVTSYRHKLGE